MEPTKPKLPLEAIELLSDFIHGEISQSRTRCGNRENQHNRE